MRRDWEYLRVLLNVSEHLAGHPNLKGLRDEALADIADFAAEPPMEPDQPEVQPEVEQEPVTEPEPTVKLGRRHV